MATAPNFAATPHSSGVLVNTANTNTDGTGGGSFPTVFTAGANGSLVDAIRIKSIIAIAAVGVADTVRIWLYNGATKILLFEQAVTAITPAAGTPGYDSGWLALGVQLPNGSSILASTDVGGATASYHVSANGGDY